MPTSIDFIRASRKIIEVLDNIQEFSEATKLVREFNKSFEIPVSNKPIVGEEKDFTLKHKLLLEEVQEYLEACKNNDIVEIADSLTDIMYVLLGTVLHHGLSNVYYDLFLEVHASNMSKLEKGKVLRRSDGKVMKGSEYFKPNLKDIINERY